MSTEQRETLDAILRQSAFPAGSSIDEQRQLLGELLSAQPLSAEVTVTTAALGGVPTAEITVDGVEPRHVVLYFHGGVYVLGEAADKTLDAIIWGEPEVLVDDTSRREGPFSSLRTPLGDLYPGL
jgi:acetyl esterase/lipase